MNAGYIEQLTIARIEKIARSFAIKPSGCWEWLGCKRVAYGSVGLKNKLYLAHRVMYTQIYGPIPSGMVVDHLCRNTVCVNPKHLEAVTFGTNVRRGNAMFAGSRNSAKTHCPRGHEYTQENTYIGKSARSRNGTCRSCRECMKIGFRERWHKNNYIVTGTCRGCDKETTMKKNVMRCAPCMTKRNRYYDQFRVRDHGRV